MKGLLMLALALALVSCTPVAPTPVPQTPVTNGGITCNAGSNSTVTCGNVNTAPTPPPDPAEDNVVKSMPVTCYGFGAKPEPNHDACILPVGYPAIDMTASPKNAAGKDVPKPGPQTDPGIIDWTFAVSPAGAATLVIKSENRFNVTVQPASPRVPATFTATAIYHDPEGNEWKTSKTGSIQ